ncbi:hypothetical protein GCM10017764_35440 [Sphingobacterium griseoflavum]|uniref:Uncharacterized protein n=2 Tax=Sphingobacterium griseoflavum TaxID=1474952 RepID=A0ABQ3HZ25_9SPHI|nr:hypothetical protein GCM10017764_35440 [Sphingobacterium griseoflavum]
MFEIDLYLKAIVDAFYEKRNQKELDHLRRATRRDLMKEFLRRLENGELDSELSELMKIFGDVDHADDLKKEIKKAGADKFRPLQDFLQERTSKPTDNVIKLLAIFIDFKPRPFDVWLEEKRTTNDETGRVGVADADPDEADIAKKKTGESAESIIAKNSFAARYEEKPLSESGADALELRGTNSGTAGRIEPVDIKKNTEQPQTNTAIAAAPPYESSRQNETNTTGRLMPGRDAPLQKVSPRKTKIFLLTSSGIALVYMIFSLYPKKDCMCWNGEKYVEVDCHNKTFPYQVIGLDRQQLSYFAKIQREDTLSMSDVGRVWYSKIDNEVEFFTQPGFHPVKLGHALKIATEHIITKYAGENARKKIQIDSPNHTASP